MQTLPLPARPQETAHSSNVTGQFLRDVGHDHATMWEFYQYVLDDLPDPLHPGQLLTYGQVLADADHPVGVERAAAYARAKGYTFPVTAAAYAAQQYDEARGRLLARAYDKPSVLAFSSDAVAAFAASRNHPVPLGQELSAEELRQFFQPEPATYPPPPTDHYDPTWQVFQTNGSGLPNTLPVGTTFYAAPMPAEEWERIQHRVVVVQTDAVLLLGRVLANELPTTGTLVLYNDVAVAMYSVAAPSIQALWVATFLIERKIR